MEGDRRSFRVAVVSDTYVNPSPGEMDALVVLVAEGCGAIQLPADGYPAEVAGPLLEQVAEQAEEFHRHGYDLVVIGGREGLDEALGEVGMLPLETISPTDAEELYAFLRGRPLPTATVSPD
jgi:hypothetical protein